MGMVYLLYLYVVISYCIELFDYVSVSRNSTLYIPSGKSLHNYGNTHHFEWEKSVLVWPFSVAIVVNILEMSTNCEIHRYSMSVNWRV